MKVTKDYYKEWHEETKALFQQAEDEETIMRPNRIWAKVEEVEKHTKYFRIPFRKQRFARIVKMARIYAKDACVDITYETTSEHGFLRFEMDQVIIDDVRPEYWRVWRYLIRHADTFWVNTIDKYGDPALQFTFFISFRKRIEQKAFIR